MCAKRSSGIEENYKKFIKFWLFFSWLGLTPAALGALVDISWNLLLNSLIWEMLLERRASELRRQVISWWLSLSWFISFVSSILKAVPKPFVCTFPHKRHLSQETQSMMLKVMLWKCAASCWANGLGSFVNKTFSSKCHLNNLQDKGVKNALALFKWSITLRVLLTCQFLVNPWSHHALQLCRQPFSTLFYPAGMADSCTKLAVQ